jgi:hypothetical protein
MLQHKSTADYKEWDKAKYVKLAKMNPVKYLVKSHGEFFYVDGEDFCVSGDVDRFRGNKEFVEHFRDAVEFRVREYYKGRMEEK